MASASAPARVGLYVHADEHVCVCVCICRNAAWTDFIVVLLLYSFKKKTIINNKQHDVHEGISDINSRSSIVVHLIKVKTHHLSVKTKTS